LIDAQSNDGICWDLRAKGKTHKVIFKPEVCMFVGDNEGQTKACGMYQMCGNKGVKSLCHHCKVETCEIHRAYNEIYELHNRKQINDWIEQALGKVTNTVCWHDNALRDQILQFMLDRLLPLINTMDPISIYHHLYRTCARKEYLFKSDPMDANHKFRGHGWHDWALVWLVYKEFV
jgi:hypothetical protein